ncbi:MAG: dihydroorotase [Patescibacteria group bacterium]
MNEAIEIRKPDDWHVHLREGEMLNLVLPWTAGCFGRAMVMPNLSASGICTVSDALSYRQAIENRRLQAKLSADFQALMTVKITPQTLPEMMTEAKRAGIIAGKLYPDGVTTGSEGGVSDFQALYPVLAAMQEVDLALSIHCELPGSPILTAEQDFIPILADIIANFPKLRIVVEHLSSRTMLEYVLAAPANVGATITAHHLVLTKDQVLNLSGRVMFAHRFCKPMAKEANDQAALIKAVVSGFRKIWFGSDSAPHSRCDKKNKNPPAGVFSAPVVLPILAQIFEDAGQLDRLEAFTSQFGAEFYGLPLNKGSIRLEKKAWTVSCSVGEDSATQVVPFFAGQRLDWQVV